MQAFNGVVLIAMALFHSCRGYPSGPPIDINSQLCTTMFPDHGPYAQQSTPPFELVSSTTCYSAGQSLTVTLRALNASSGFKGFFIEARKSQNKSFSHGTFDSLNDQDIKTLDCFNQNSSAIGHSNPQARIFATKTFGWTAPQDVNDLSTIEFTATVVQSKPVFWMGLISPIARCRHDGSNFTADLTNRSSDATVAPVESTQQVPSDLTNRSSGATVASVEPTQVPADLMNGSSGATVVAGNTTQETPATATVSGPVFSVTTGVPSNRTDTVSSTTGISSVTESTTITGNQTTSDASFQRCFNLWSIAAVLVYSLIAM